jgi:GAF domain-containing protein
MNPTRDSTFADPQQIIAELQRQLAECRAERDEALQRETATAEVLQVINSSPGDLAPVFDAMLEKAVRLCDGSNGILWTFDDERARLAASRNMSPEIVELLRQQGESGTHPLVQRVIAGDHLFQFDLAEHDAHRSRRVAAAADVVASGVRTKIWVALVKDGTAVGAFVISRQEVRPFTDKQIALLQNFAAQAVIAMENARLLTETREALEQRTATAEVLQVINSSPGNLQPVFDAMLDKAMHLCGVDHAALELYDGERMHAAAVHGASDRFAETLREGYRAIDHPAARALLEGQRFVEIADATQVDQVAFRTAAEVDGIGTVLFVPLRRDDVLLGMIASARRQVHPFADREIALLQNFAQQAVIAMENARLLGALRQRTEEVAELNRGLETRVADQVEELGRVGRLKRFLAPQLAELIVSQGDEKILESHRREIVVVFCDLRGYTAFTETAEPEEVLDFLREYHGALGPLVSQFEGTLDQFSGDGIMVFFNDPVPCPDPAERAVKMAMAMREEAGKLIAACCDREQRDRTGALRIGAHNPGRHSSAPRRVNPHAPRSGRRIRRNPWLRGNFCRPRQTGRRRPDRGWRAPP